MASYAEPREKPILRQWLVDDGAPQKSANRAAYIPAHYIHRSHIVESAGPRGLRTGRSGEKRGVRFEVGEWEGPTSRHYAGTESKVR
jgi:hypothetical protein